MNKLNRELLVVGRHANMDEQEMQLQMDFLNIILFRAEAIHNYCQANEVMDFNRYRIIRKPHQVAKAIRLQLHKPFVFLCNKN